MTQLFTFCTIVGLLFELKSPGLVLEKGLLLERVLYVFVCSFYKILTPNFFLNTKISFSYKFSHHPYLKMGLYKFHFLVKKSTMLI